MASRGTYQNICPEVKGKPLSNMSPDAFLTVRALLDHTSLILYLWSYLKVQNIRMYDTVSTLSIRRLFKKRQQFIICVMTLTINYCFVTLVLQGSLLEIDKTVHSTTNYTPVFDGELKFLVKIILKANFVNMMVILFLGRSQVLHALLMLQII